MSLIASAERVHLIAVNDQREMNCAMLGSAGGILLSKGQQRLGAFESVRLPGDGAFDRIVQLAQFLLDADAAIVDLDDLSCGAASGGVVGGVSTAFGEGQRSSLAGETELADPIKALNMGFVAQASVPIRACGERLGTLAVLSRAQREFDARAIEILRRLAELVGEGVLLRQRLAGVQFETN